MTTKKKSAVYTVDADIWLRSRGWKITKSNFGSTSHYKHDLLGFWGSQEEAIIAEKKWEKLPQSQKDIAIRINNLEAQINSLFRAVDVLDQKAKKCPIRIFGMPL